MLESFKQLSVIGARVQKFTSDKGWALGTGGVASAPIEGDRRVEWDVWKRLAAGGMSSVLNVRCPRGSREMMFGPGDDFDGDLSFI